jgi:hypothetical protein
VEAVAAAYWKCLGFKDCCYYRWNPSGSTACSACSAPAACSALDGDKTKHGKKEKGKNPTPGLGIVAGDSSKCAGFKGCCYFRWNPSGTTACLACGIPALHSSHYGDETKHRGTGKGRNPSPSDQLTRASHEDTISSHTASATYPDSQPLHGKKGSWKHFGKGPSKREPGTVGMDTSLRLTNSLSYPSQTDPGHVATS